MEYIKSAIEAILFAAGDSVPVDRLSLVLGKDSDEIRQAAEWLSKDYENNSRGIRLLFLEDNLQLCSAPEYSTEIINTLETRRPASLSRPALEVLSIVAYFQPVTRAYVDQVRGVDSSYTMSTLIQKGLIKSEGKLEAPGRPALFITTDAFLRTMGISSISQLPKLPEVSDSDGLKKLQDKIDELQKNESSQQISIDDTSDNTQI